MRVGVKGSVEQELDISEMLIEATEAKLRMLDKV